MPVVFALIFLLGLGMGYALSGNMGTGNFFSKNKGATLQEISNLIKSKYVQEIDVDSINAYAADEMLSHLDPHSVYISPKDLQGINDAMEGQFVGIGIMYNSINDTLNILKIIKNGPAEKAGVLIGDKLLKVNDSIVLIGKNIKDNYIKNNIRGEEGSLIKLLILRDGVVKKINVTRAAIPIPSIDAAYIIAPKTGYIKINKFAERTYEEFMQNLERLQKQKIENLILDLRDNGGGYMHAATAIADEFLDGEKMIVYTEGKHTNKNEFRCKKEGLFENGKLIVLINETSASASEVLAGALQDWDRATIVGRRSFGKGLVQQQYNLSDGGALRLTVARYYTPLGRNIQKTYSGGKQKYMQELEERYSYGEMIKVDSILQKGKEYKTPKGHLVFDGGGITPDYFIGIDTANYTPTIIALFYKDVIEKFVFNFYNNNKTTLKKLTTATDVINKLSLTNNDWNLLQSIAQKDSIDISKISEVNKTYLIQKIKANVAKTFINDEVYTEVENLSDAVVKKAVELLKQ